MNYEEYEYINKIEQISNYCKVSDFHKTYKDILSIIPKELIMQSDKMLMGKLIDNIKKSWENTKSLRDKEIIAEGCIFDGEKLLEICQK